LDLHNKSRTFRRASEIGGLVYFLGWLGAPVAGALTPLCLACAPLGGSDVP